MAVIALRCAWVLAALAMVASADQPQETLAVVHHLAAALTNGNPADAIADFDKSFKDYAKVRDYFSALTDSFQLANEADLVDEQDEQDATVLNLRWTLSTMDSNNVTRRHTEQVRVKLKQIKDSWKIVEFTPIDLFNPIQSSARNSS